MEFLIQQGNSATANYCLVCFRRFVVNSRIKEESSQIFDDPDFPDADDLDDQFPEFQSSIPRKCRTNPPSAGMPDAVELLASLLKLSPNSKQRLLQEFKVATVLVQEPFCPDCSTTLFNVKEVLDQLKSLEQQVEVYKVQIESQLRQCPSILVDSSRVFMATDQVPPAGDDDVRLKVGKIRQIIMEEFEQGQHAACLLVPQNQKLDTGNNRNEDNDQELDDADDNVCWNSPSPALTDQNYFASGDFPRRISLIECKVVLERLQCPIPTTKKRRRRKLNSDKIKKKPAAKVSKTSKKLKRRSSNAAVFACSDCSKTYPSERRLASHQAKCHPSSPYTHICSHCGKRFVRALSLQTHLRAQDGICKKRPLPANTSVITETGPYQFRCNLCQTKCVSSTRLLNHMSMHTHTLEKRFICEECGQGFSRFCYLRMHKQVKHCKPGQLNPFSCQIDGCPKSFSSKANLELHEKLAHRHEFSAFCQVCDFKTVSQGLLNAHFLRHHSGLRKHKCTQCESTFKSAPTLQRHIYALHTAPEDKPFKCRHCPKTFSNKYGLDNHEITHTGEKPKACPICGKRFAIHQYVVTHLKTHGVVGSAGGRTKKTKHNYSNEDAPTHVTAEASSVLGHNESCDL